jgi:uncharacterized membrane protein (DUF373 family)
MDRHTRQEQRRRRSQRPTLMVDLVEDLVHYVIVVMLVGIAVAVLFHTSVDLVRRTEPFAVRVTEAINGVLFVIILLELLRTVMAHFETSELQLQPFIIIGVISAVRHLLTVGARLTLAGEGSPEAFRQAQIELGVEAAVVLALAIALLLIRRSEPTDSAGHRPG